MTSGCKFINNLVWAVKKYAEEKSLESGDQAASEDSGEDSRDENEDDEDEYSDWPYYLVHDDG